MSTVTEERLAVKLAEPLPVRSSAGVSVAGSGLSPRQREILALCAEGLTREEIAEVLVVSKETVKTQVRHVLTKLEARNITHAVAIAYGRGVFTCDVCECGGSPECPRCSPT